MTVKVGVLSIQGNIEEHMEHMRKVMEAGGIEGKVIRVRKAEDIYDIHGLIIPGGESTTISGLMVRWGLYDAIKDVGTDGLPVFGTCAGTIILASKISGHGSEEVVPLGFIEMEVIRNAYGRQRESFEGVVHTRLGDVLGVFIRAPGILRVWGGAEVWGRCGEDIVMVVQGNKIATTFHPELTHDLTIHGYFLDLVRDYAGR